MRASVCVCVCSRVSPSVRGGVPSREVPLAERTWGPRGEGSGVGPNAAQCTGVGSRQSSVPGAHAWMHGGGGHVCTIFHIY